MTERYDIVDVTLPNGAVMRVAARGRGPRDVGAFPAFNLDHVRQAIQGLAEMTTQAWDTTKPDSVTVKFGLDFEATSGALVALLVEGGASASLQITLVWGTVGTD